MVNYAHTRTDTYIRNIEEHCIRKIVKIFLFRATNAYMQVYAISLYSCYLGISIVVDLGV